MKATVDAHTLRLALKRLKPRSQYRSMRETHVTVAAGGTSLVLQGSLDSSASVEALVAQPGTTRIPLDAAIKLLSTYVKRSSVVLRAEPTAVWFDKLRFTVEKGD